MALNDYSNPSENILFAFFDENLLDYNGNSFTSAGGTPEFLEDEEVGKYIQVPKSCYLDISNSEFAVGAGDFTLDAWIKNFGAYCSVSTTKMSGGQGLALWPGENCGIVGYGSGGVIKIPFTPNIGKWVHYAIVRKNGIFYAFQNGILCGSRANTNNNLINTSMRINAPHTNRTNSNTSNCYKNVRLCNFARWTEDFTPPDPTEEFPSPEPVDMKLHILLKVEQTVNLTGYMWPVGDNPPNLIWSSEDSSIASVGQNGTVTANAVGKTKIYVQNEDGSFKAFARIKVVEEGEDELLLSILLEIGESCILVPEFDPQEAEIAVLWTSSNSSIATVNAVGKVTGLAEGLAIITAQTADGKLTDSMYVTVKPQD